MLVVDAVHYVSHWITPELAPRRYDTRFFITAAPAGQVARHDDAETIATIWVRPHDALAREAAGEIELLPPTIANLRSIEGFTSAGEVDGLGQSGHPRHHGAADRAHRGRSHPHPAAG